MAAALPERPTIADFGRTVLGSWQGRTRHTHQAIAGERALLLLVRVWAVGWCWHAEGGAERNVAARATAWLLATRWGGMWWRRAFAVPASSGRGCHGRRLARIVLSTFFVALPAMISRAVVHGKGLAASRR